MAVVLQMWEEGNSNSAADRGNLVHAAAKAFHTTTEADRVAAGVAALEAARAKFPLGDPKEATTIFRAYAADPKNAKAVVRWCEQNVRLTLDPAPEDDTGQPVVIDGTLDQVREENGTLTVWDIKTGDAKDQQETIDEYMIQQAAYTLAAMQTLDANVRPGGIIYTPGYAKKRKVFLPLPLTVETCRILIQPLVHTVALIRKGVPAFRPSASDCKYCPFKPWPSCHRTFKGMFGL